jgi:predicted RNA binding protein YcfA (HicA-like mRNA interferase family)
MKVGIVEEGIEGDEVHVQGAHAQIEHEENKVTVVVEAHAVHHPRSVVKQTNPRFY